MCCQQTAAILKPNDNLCNVIQIIQTLRWGILRHQYGIFVAQSQTFLLAKRPQRRRAKEKRMLSQASNIFIHYLQNQQILHSLLKDLFLLLAVESAFPQENHILVA